MKRLMRSTRMLKRFLLYIFLFLISVFPVFFGNVSVAGEPLAADTVMLNIRQPDSGFADNYRAQKEFIYTQTEVGTNFYQQLVAFLKKHSGRIAKVTKALPWIIKVLIGIFVIAVFLIIVTQTKLYRLFYTAQEINKTPDFLFTDPINHIDYNRELQKAVGEEQFRLAVRLLYNQVIIQLKGKRMIEYAKDKTNMEYMDELANNNIRSKFYQAMLIYNHVWYGEVEISKEQFLKFNIHFQSIFSMLDGEE